MFAAAGCEHTNAVQQKGSLDHLKPQSGLLTPAHVFLLLKMDRRTVKEYVLMKRVLLALAGYMALFALATPTPANAAVWCGWYWTWYGRCYVAYTVVRPVAVAVRPVVTVRPVYAVAYRRTMVPYYYTAVTYRPAVMPYRTVAYTRTVSPYRSYAYVPSMRRRWIYY